MGQINTKLIDGRGDKYQAYESVLDRIIKTELDVLRKKYDKLDKEEQSEIEAMLGGIDPKMVIDSQWMADMHVASLEDKCKKKLMEDLFAFCDAHPIQLEQAQSKVTTAVVENKQKAQVKKPVAQREEQKTKVQKNQPRRDSAIDLIFQRDSLKF